MPPRFVAVPRRHVAASGLAWRISRALVARQHGWSLETIAASRRWQFQVAGSRWIAHAFASFFFYSRGQPGGVYAIHFEGTGSASALEDSALVRELRDRLGTYTLRPSPVSMKPPTLVRKLAESRPRVVLAELDRIAHAFGAIDRHRAPASRSRAGDKRLVVIAETVVAHGTWSLAGMQAWLRRDDDLMAATISPIPRSAHDRPALSTLLFVGGGKASGAMTDLMARAGSHGYVDRAGEGHPDIALMKLQPLSLRAAVSEARFLESVTARRE